MDDILFNRRATPYEQGLGIRIAKAFHRMGEENGVRQLEITACEFAAWVTRPEFGVRPSFIKLDYLAKLSGVRFKWLVTGFGPMLKKKARKAESE